MRNYLHLLLLLLSVNVLHAQVAYDACADAQANPQSADETFSESPEMTNFPNDELNFTNIGIPFDHTGFVTLNWSGTTGYYTIRISTQGFNDYNFSYDEDGDCILDGSADQLFEGELGSQDIPCFYFENGTDYTFGFSTAVQIATDCFDKLVTTAESHHRVIIMEVMGRDAGWIALHTAIAGGAEMVLIPEIPYDPDKVLAYINKRYRKGKGFMNIVIAEGAKPIDGDRVGQASGDIKDEHLKLGGICNQLRYQLEQMGCGPQIRTTILGHIQRGGTPVAFDRILATAMGVKAFEMVKEEQFGQMVSFANNEFVSIPLASAIAENKNVTPNHALVKVARSIGISFGD